MTLRGWGSPSAAYDRGSQPVTGGSDGVISFRPARQVRLYEEVADQLREAILSGQYQPGDRLPTERELMSSFEVSRAVVRQATMNLEHEGLVEVQVGSGGGTFVVESHVDTVIRAFEYHFRHNSVSLDHYISAKRALEPALAAAVLSGGTEADWDRLAENIGRSAEALARDADDREQLRLSLEFHELLVAATRNPVLEALFIALVRMGERVPAFISPVHTDWSRLLAEHRELLDALRACDEARFTALLLSHLKSVNHIYGEEADPDH